MATIFDFQRFLDAQAPVFDAVHEELREGRKRSHWMWFIFPQIKGLGRSSIARRYEISSLAEASAYLAHPVLGARLRDCTRLVLSHGNRRISAIFDPPDDLKFRSSMTLFSWAARDEPLFQQALDRFFDGEPDPATLWALRSREPAA